VQDNRLFSFSIRISTPPDQRWNLIRSLGAFLQSTRVEPGCLEVRLLADLDEPNWIELIEEWESREMYERQMVSDKLKTLIAAIDLSVGNPTVRFDGITREEGISVFGSVGKLPQRSTR
jgi:quinol monooxygenase YgiN